MMNREELLKLKSYAYKTKVAAHWLNDRVRELVDKEIGMSKESHPETGLLAAFEALDNHLHIISNILEEEGIKQK